MSKYPQVRHRVAPDASIRVNACTNISCCKLNIGQQPVYIYKKEEKKACFLDVLRFFLRVIAF